MSRLAIMTIAVLFAVVPGTVLSQSPPPMPEPPDKCHIVDPIVELVLKIDELLHHAEQVRTRSARRVYDGDLVQGLGNLRRRPQGDARCVPIVNEPSYRLTREAGVAAFEVALEGLADT